MKMTLVPQQYFDGDGNPLIGRLSVYNRSTDTEGTEISGTYAKLYTFADGEYSDAANPQLLDSEGRLPSAVYFDAAVVTVKLEKYTGDSSMGSDDESEHWELVDTYDTGMEWKEETSGFAASIADLKTVDTDASPVTVTGYYTEGDSPSRTYFWDADSTAAEDGGYIVASSSTSKGRWILAWADEIMPCTLYGVFPGKMENFANLLSYPRYVGTSGLATAPRIRFVYGAYDTGSTDWSTDKDLIFDPFAGFSGTGTMSCRRVEAYGSRRAYIGDFKFTGASSSKGNDLHGAVAHSSWFRTLDAFWDCGARRLVLDAVNFFTVFTCDTVTATHSIYNATIESHRSQSLSSEYHRTDRSDYSDGTFLDLHNCAIEGVAFGRYDRVKFNGFVFDQSWFERGMASGHYNFGDVSAASGAAGKISLYSSDDNVIDIDRFASAVVYAKAAAADGLTTLNLRGRAYSMNALPDGIVSVANAVFDAESFDVDRDLTLTGCTANGLSVTGSGVTLALTDTRAASITANGALSELNIVGGGVVGGSVAKASVNALGAAVGFSIANGSASEAYGGEYAVNMRKCAVSGEIACEQVMVDACSFTAKVTVFPYLNDSNEYTLFAVFAGNLFEGAGEIVFAARDRTGDEYTKNDEIKRVELRIVGNRFLGTSANGVTMPAALGVYEQASNESSGWEAAYLSNDATVSCEYKDNAGTCPRESFAGQYSFDLSDGISDERDYSMTAVSGRVFALSSVSKTTSEDFNLMSPGSNQFANPVGSLATRNDEADNGALHWRAMKTRTRGAVEENDMFARFLILSYDGDSGATVDNFTVNCVNLY